MTNSQYLQAALRHILLNPGCYRQGFEDWLLDNLEIQRRFDVEVLHIASTGRAHYSAYTIVEYLRHHTALYGRGVVVNGGEAKSGTSIAVPLNDAAINALQAEAGKHPEFVFTYRGRPMAKPKEGFAQALRDCRLTDFTWHGLRHTWATWHIQNGTPADVLQKLGGWADIRMVLNYAHHSAGHLARYANNTGEMK